MHIDFFLPDGQRRQQAGRNQVLIKAPVEPRDTKPTTPGVGGKSRSRLRSSRTLISTRPSLPSIASSASRSHSSVGFGSEVFHGCRNDPLVPLLPVSVLYSLVEFVGRVSHISHSSCSRGAVARNPQQGKTSSPQTLLKTHCHILGLVNAREAIQRAVGGRTCLQLPDGPVSRNYASGEHDDQNGFILHASLVLQVNIVFLWTMAYLDDFSAKPPRFDRFSHTCYIGIGDEQSPRLGTS